MDAGRVLVNLIVVLVAARVASEIAERIRQSAVLAEIVTGIFIGPSALRLTKGGDDIALLAELGVILLLFEVGRQTDLRSLARVGRSSLQVACIGVAVPMALGFLAMRAVHLSPSVAVFLAAGITATSVGITARVFGDLRALSTTEARIVLGAAVADDVIGLVVLAIVIGTSHGEGVSVASLATTVGGAVGFLTAATALGAMAAPRLLSGVKRRSRADGTVMAVGLAVALAFAWAAQAAELAPIVGAFVAGIAVGGSEVADDLHRRLTPLGQLLIPVFFLQIGMQAKIGSFAEPWVLGVAGLLCIVAVGGKLVAGIGARRGTADRLLVGVAMIPRGEVGLIFATIGLTEGVLGPRPYAVLLLVVLVSTLVTPPWIRHRIDRARTVAASRAPGPVPTGGWLVFGMEEIDLVGDPPPSMAGEIALEAALASAKRRPAQRLMSWLASQTEHPTWDEPLRRHFFGVIQGGSERSWRFLEITGSLRWLLPELDAALARRPRDPFDLDPGASHRLPVLDGLRSAVAEDKAAAAVWAELREYEEVLLGALVRDLSENGARGSEAARELCQAIGWSAEHAERVTFLVASRHLLPAAAGSLDVTTEHHVLDLASFVETVERLDGLYLLAVAENAMEPWERERLDELRALIIQALGKPELTGPGARAVVEARLQAVRSAMPDLTERAFRRFVDDAPRRYLLVHSPDTIIRHLRMTHPKMAKAEVRLEAESIGERSWAVHVAFHDRPGGLAGIAAAFAANGVAVVDALISTWDDGIAIDVFRVEAPADVPWDLIRRSITEGLTGRAERDATTAGVSGQVSIDDRASPWHSIVELRTPDRAGLLARVAAAISRAGLEIHEARVTTQEGEAVDSFWVTGRTGHKLTPTEEAALRRALAGGASRWSRLRRLRAPRSTEPEQSQVS